MTAIAPPPLPSALDRVLELGLARGAVELRSFFRERDAVIFTFSLPAVLLLLLGSVLNNSHPGHGVTAGAVSTASMVGAGIVSTSFTSLGVGIAVERDDGTLKRLRGTPLPPVSYFLGKLILVAVSSLAEVALLLVIGVALFHVSLPSDPGRWLTFGWVFALGVTACSLLGIAASSLPRSARSASAVMTLPFLVLQFVSGVYVTPITTLPRWMVDVASVFPVKWLAQGFRSVFLPDALRTQEAAGTWEHGRIALILGVWCVVGLALGLRTFRWTRHR